MAYPNGLDFSKIYPWSDIKTVQRDGQTMIYVPKTYTKEGKLTSGKYAGSRYWMTSKTKGDGFHLPACFMYKGQEIDHFCFGAYEASRGSDGKPESKADATPWVNAGGIQKAIDACNSRNTGASGSEQYGWHLQTYYERSFIARLMMIECGTPDVQTAIGRGKCDGSWNGSFQGTTCGSTSASWRGLHEFWGNCWEWCDGLQMDGSGKYKVFDKQGNGTYVSTNIPLADKGFAMASGDNFDLGDLFVPGDDGTNGSYTGSTGDGLRAGTNTILFTSGCWGDGSYCGAFCFIVNNRAENSHANIGFRLAKYDV